MAWESHLITATILDAVMDVPDTRDVEKEDQLTASSHGGAIRTVTILVSFVNALGAK